MKNDMKFCIYLLSQHTFVPVLLGDFTFYCEEDGSARGWPLVRRSGQVMVGVVLRASYSDC